MTETAAMAWDRCRGWIEAALAHSGGGYRIEDVAARIEAGKAHFWAGKRCAVVTEFIHAPRLVTLNFWLLGGDIKELMTMRPQIEQWAKAQGCGCVIGGGVKPGWARVLGKFGYRPGWTIYMKELGA